MSVFVYSLSGWFPLLMEIFDFLVVFLFWMGAILGGLSILLLAIAYHFREYQNNLLYFPETPEGSTSSCESPSEKGIQNFENVHIRTADGVTLRGFVMWPLSTHPQRSTSNVSSSSSFPGCASQPQYTIIYFHGNAGNVGHRIPIASMFTSRHPCVVLMMDYRGYGLSDRVAPTESGLKLDAQACLEYVWSDERFPRKGIFVMGTSLGGAVAVHLAAQPENTKRIAGVIVENSFTSVGDMACVIAKSLTQHFLPHCTVLANGVFKYYFKPLCLQIDWGSIDLVEKVRAPMLFISGLKDELVPPEQMRELYTRAARSSSFRKFVEVPEGNHNSVSLTPGYVDIINNFVQDALNGYVSELV